MQDWDDKRLLARIAERDTTAMRVFYERHQSALRGFLRARGAEAEEASDLLHDAMLDVWRTAARFGGASSARTWLFAIARNKYVDRVRRGTRVSFVEEVPESSDTEPDSETILASAEDAARVRACLDGLKAAQRLVVRLAFFDGLTYEEIAAVEDVPAGTVKSRIFHAKQALLRCLGS
ncbi:MAG: sigma-70 family RNA polymerase sigma factor [Pseudomonadota bacterium]